MKGLLSLLVKSGPGDLNHQEELKIERESRRRIKSAYAAAASIKKATNGEYTCQLSRLGRDYHAYGSKTSMSRLITPADQFLTPDWKKLRKIEITDLTDTLTKIYVNSN